MERAMPSFLSQPHRARRLTLLGAVAVFLAGSAGVLFSLHALLHAQRLLSAAAAAGLSPGARGLWGEMLVAVTGLAVAAFLVCRELRGAAQREGAWATREELLERSSDGYFALDRDFRFLYVNGEGARIARMARETVRGKTLWEVWPELIPHELGAQYRAAMASAVPRSYEVHWSQEQAWLEVRFFPSREGLSVFLRDVTERRRILTALAESEARHRRIVQTAEEGIWILDAGGCITFVNQKVCELLGYDRDALLGKHLFDFMDTEGQRIAAENLQRRGLGLREQHDFKLTRKDGSTLWGLLATSPLSASDEGDTATLAMLTDLTDRRRAESERSLLLSRERTLRAAAEASHDRYRVLANLVPHLVWTHRADGSVDFVNRCFSQITGQPAEQALGSGWQATLHPEDLPGYLEAWKAALLSGEPFQREVRMRRADGTWRRHLNMAHAARDSDGRLLRWFGVALETDL
jgi:PAS domain S-box-containing protein